MYPATIHRVDVSLLKVPADFTEGEKCIPRWDRKDQLEQAKTNIFSIRIFSHHLCHDTSLVLFWKKQFIMCRKNSNKYLKWTKLFQLISFLLNRGQITHGFLLFLIQRPLKPSLYLLVACHSCSFHRLRRVSIDTFENVKSLKQPLSERQMGKENHDLSFETPGLYKE